MAAMARPDQLRQALDFSPMTEATHASADQFARLLEIAGVMIIIGGAIIASFLFARSGLMIGDWRSAYVQCRSNLGRHSVGARASRRRRHPHRPLRALACSGASS